MTDEKTSDEHDDILARAARLSPIIPGAGFVNQGDGCRMDPDVDAAIAKAILDRLARHISPGDWQAALGENPNWKGALVSQNAAT